MASSTSRSYDDMITLSDELGNKQKLIPPFLREYRKEIVKPEYQEIPRKYQAFRYWLLAIISYSMFIGIIILDYKLFSDATGGAGNMISIVGTMIMVVAEIATLWMIFEAIQKGKLLRMSPQKSPVLNMVKFIPVIVAGFATGFKMFMELEYAETMKEAFPYILKGGIIFLSFLMAYIVLIYLAQRGLLFQGLSIPFEILKKKKEIQKAKEKSRNQDKINQLTQKITELVNDWIQSIGHYNVLFNPVLQDGTPNPNYLIHYSDDDKEGFSYIPFQHSLTDIDAQTINEIYQREIIPVNDNIVNPPVTPPKNNRGGGLPQPKPDNDTEPPSNDDRPLTGGGNQLVTD